MTTQSQMILPLLAALDGAGGSLKAKHAADAVAEALDLTTEERERTIATTGGKTINAFDRSVRWTQQLAKLRGLTTGSGTWHLTDLAGEKIRVASPGIVVTVYESEDGIVLWGEAEAIESRLQAESINLVVTSPPYPLVRQKAYGNLDEISHVSWLADRAAAWLEALTPDGSLFLNVGDCWLPGQPTQSLYQERLLIKLADLGYHLAQRLYWENPAKLPAPAEWVTIRRIRVTPSIEQIYWLAKTPNPKADNSRALRPYSASARRMLARGGTNAGQRPSGHTMAAGAFAADNGGSIAHSLLIEPNTDSNDPYHRACREQGLEAHPATFPAALPEFAIKLPTDAGDTVLDPFGGSLTTAAAARRLGRRFITCDRDRGYLEAGLARLTDATSGAKSHAVTSPV